MHKIIWCLILMTSVYSTHYGQFSDGNKSLKAHEFTDAPVIDGQVISDAIWSTIPAIDDMIQSKPNLGAPASERTEIRIGFDNQYLYVAVVCHDGTPEKIVVADARRDANLDATDAFLFILDTYHDTQNGFVFGTNSIGVKYDAQVDNEGQGNFNNNRQQGGTIGGFNLNWDASWEVATEVGGYGWSAEFAIPLKTLRFAPGNDKTWGINFQRNIQKTNEIVYWAPLPNGLNLYRLSLAGDLTGLSLKKPGNLKVIPYVLGSASKKNLESDETDYDVEFGVDLKYSLSANMTLDLTYNTDFAQVEVDEQQVNLDRFNLFFPEKRPFFLENAGLFTVGSPGEVDLFFTRRIGIGPNGEQVPIIGGARLSGKINRTNIGLLNMYTDDVESAGIEKNSFAVVRVNHEFKGRSSLGGLIVNRSGLGSADDDHNSTYAIDGKLGLGPQAQLSGYYARTSTPGIDAGQHSFQFQSVYLWNNWILRASYTEVGEGFNPEVGFLARSAFKKVEGLIFYNLRYPESSPMLEIRPHISYRGYWNFSGLQETGFLHVDNHWVWKTGTEIHTGVNFKKEGVTSPFTISNGIEVPAGVYDHIEAQIVFFTNRSKPFSIGTRHILGGFFGGSRSAHSGTFRARIGDKFSSEWSLSHNDISLPNGDFTTDVFRSRLSYSFTPSLFIQGLIQYNSVIDSWSTNVRLGWLKQANTGLFIVYNETREDSFLDNQSFIVKYSVLLDVLK